jgi:rhodanese-related sulfurtransferase
VARILMDQGYTNVKAILGGFRAGQEAGYPVTGGQ